MYIKRFEKYGDTDIRESKFYTVVFAIAHEVIPSNLNSRQRSIYNFMDNLSKEDFKMESIYNMDIVKLIQSSSVKKEDAENFLAFFQAEIDFHSEDDESYKGSVNFLRGGLEIKEFSLIIKESGEDYNIL